MKKFSKLLAVVLAVAVVICPMMSVVANADASAPAGTYNLSSDGANDVVLTLSSDDGFMVYQATVTFNSDTAFQSTYNTSPYTNGIKVVDYAVIDGDKDSHNAPKVTAQKSGAALEILVMPTDNECLDLYSEIQLGFRVATGSSATLSKIQAANDGTEITDDAELLEFPAANSTTGVIDQTADYAKENAVTNAHEHNFTAQTVSAAYLRSAATCTAKATYYYACTVCGAAGTTWYENGEMLAHTATNTTTYKVHDATCTEPLTYYQECSVCNAPLTSTWTSGSALGHSTVEVPATNSTCTVAGNYAYYRCTRCENVFTTAAATESTTVEAQTKPLAAHDPENTKTYVETATTCTTDGVYYQTCKDCKVKLDTTWTDTDSHLTSANHTGTLASAWSSDGTNHWHEWSCCGKKEDVAAHAGGTATHSAKAICAECGAAYGDVIPHTFNVEVVNNDTLATPADCQNAATYYYSCSCGAISDTETFSSGDVDTSNHADGCVKGAAWVTDGTNHWHVYSLCATVADLGAHTGGTATCTAQATCETCGAAYGTVGGHNWVVDEIIQPTKTTPGQKTFKCTNPGCVETMDPEVIPVPTAVSFTLSQSESVMCTERVWIMFTLIKKQIVDVNGYSDFSLAIDYEAINSEYNRYNATKVYASSDKYAQNTSGSMWYYEFSDLLIYDMTATYNATVYLYDDNGIVVGYQDIASSNLVSRLNDLAAKAATTAAQRVCFADLINYASMAQVYFSNQHKGSDLATLDLPSESYNYNQYATDTSTITANFTEYDLGTDVTGKAFACATPSVTLNAANNFYYGNIKIPTPATFAPEDCSVVVHYTDGYGNTISKTYTVANGGLVSNNNTNASRALYNVTFANLALYDMEKTIYCDVQYKGDTQFTRAYSAGVFLNANVNSAISAVVRPMAAFYKSTQAVLFASTPYVTD